METHIKPADSLSGLFKQLPEEGLPASFQHKVMQQIRKEAVRRAQRKARMEWLVVILASLIMIGLAAAALLYLAPRHISFPQLDISRIAFSGIRFYLYIGLLSLFLLWLDYRLRRVFHKEE